MAGGKKRRRNEYIDTRCIEGGGGACAARANSHDWTMGY